MTEMSPEAALAAGFGECSGKPSDCPENEGYGCCNLLEWKDRPLPKDAECARAELAALSSIKHPPRWALERICAIVRTHLQTLQARCEALQADAERYRWLRANAKDVVWDCAAGQHIFNPADLEWERDELDAAIDSARKEREQ